MRFGSALRGLLPAWVLIGCVLWQTGACAQRQSSGPNQAKGTWFVPAPPPAGSVDVTQPVTGLELGGEEQITVIGKGRPVAGPLDIPDLPGEDMSRYHRELDYLTREHRAPCAENYASVGGHEGRGSSLATGLGVPGCD